MKFGKEFASQMVPEWRDAYLDYALLKTVLKQIQEFKQKRSNHAPALARATSLERSMTLYRSFSGLTCLSRHSPRTQEQMDIENQVILVSSIRRDGTEGMETKFLNDEEEGGEYELTYFRRLDDEFNKVLKFYKGKVDEVMTEASDLTKQMNALIAFRIKVEQPDAEWVNLSDASATSTSVAHRRVPHPSMDAIDEESSTTMRHLYEESNNEIEEGTEMRPITITIQVETDNESSFRSKRPAPLNILNQVKFNACIDTPRSTIKEFLKLPKQTDLEFSKDNLKKAEEQLKTAFVEFYDKLRLLKNYGFLNLMAVSKIMKKYDKIASRSASRSYMKMVDCSFKGTSDEVSRLIERVEATFVKHFSNSNRRKGMKVLRPTAKRERHWITFSTGFLVGCAVSLFLTLILFIRARHILHHSGRETYMQTLFPLYSLFGFIVLHMLMFAANIFFWRKYRVNYSFILGFRQGTELGYREILLLSCVVGILALGCVLANMDMDMDPQTKDYQALTELLPLLLVMLLIAISICPLDIIYRFTRFFLLRSLFHCVLAPLYKVTLEDFFLADQFTSQVQALRSFEFYICYYVWGDYKHRLNSCSASSVFSTFSFIIAAVPFWWRFMQCLRRWYEERDITQGYNGIKYFMTIVAVCTRTAYTLNGGMGWRVLAWTSSIAATVIITYWDIVFDWGLLQRNSNNRWLRDTLLVPQKNVYYVAIVLDVILRLAWLQTVMNFKIFALHKQTIITLVASLEILRRGIWNFFRLENEHLNNVGKFRAFKSVPLPFNYDEDAKKDY